ncbi:MAG: hypothetical protein ABIT08_08030 [Bacteroidia bacterium]
MRKSFIYLFTFVFLALQHCRAQDIIVIKNGTEIKATVLSVTIKKIKYKKLDNSGRGVFSVPTPDVYMVIYADGTRDMLAFQSSGVKTPVTESVTLKTFIGLIYAGGSIPVGSFGGTSQYDDGYAKLGFTIGTEGNINMYDHISFFNYNINYTFHPTEFSSVEYNSIYALLGFRFQIKNNSCQFYGLINAGINHTWLGGTDFPYFESITGFAFSTGTGVVFNRKINVGFKFLSASPSNSKGYTISITCLQVIVGYEF